MTHDRRVAQQPLDVALVEPRDAMEVEAGECPPERLPLAEDRQPRQPGLEPLERELLEQPDVVRDGHTPLVVVIAAVPGVVARTPPAPDDVVLVPHQAVCEVGSAQRRTISIGRPASGTPPSSVTSHVSCM
jgi:hypothetical protein